MSKSNKRKAIQISEAEPPVNLRPPEVILDEVYEPTITECSECHSKDIITDYTEGQVFCQHCGLALGDRLISEGTEWRTFSEGSASSVDPNRVGGPENELLSEFGLSTGIGGNDDEGLSRLQNKSSSKQKSLMDAFSKAQQLATRLSLPKSVVEYTNELYKRVDASQMLRGRKMEAIVTACLFFACRHEKVPRTFKDLSEVVSADVDQRAITRCFSKIKKLKLYKLPKDSKTSAAAARAEEKSVAMAPTLDLSLDRYINALKLPFKFGAYANTVATRAMEQLKSQGKSLQPSTIAGVAIFIVAQLGADETRRTLADIGTVVKMAEGTLRSAYRMVHPHRTSIVPSDVASMEAVQKLPP